MLLQYPVQHSGKHWGHASKGSIGVRNRLCQLESASLMKGWTTRGSAGEQNIWQWLVRASLNNDWTTQGSTRAWYRRWQLWSASLMNGWTTQVNTRAWNKPWQLGFGSLMNGWALKTRVDDSGWDVRAPTRVESFMRVPETGTNDDSLGVRASSMVEQLRDAPGVVPWVAPGSAIVENIGVVVNTSSWVSDRNIPHRDPPTLWTSG